MAVNSASDGEVLAEVGWMSVSPAGLWEVQRRWTDKRKPGDDTPRLGSVCKLRVSLNTDHKDTRPQSADEAELVVSDDDDDLQVTQFARSQDSVLQVPLDRWVLLRVGDGQCDIVESCLEGMRAGERCEFTVKAHKRDCKPACGGADGAQLEKTEEEKEEELHRFSLYLHSLTPGRESWQMNPAEKWTWIQAYKQRGSERFGKGDVWGAAQSYCCAVKLVITIKGETRDDKKEETTGEGEENDTQSSHSPTVEECKTIKAELHSNLSLCQLKLNQPAKAKDSSSRATELDPASVKAWYRLGQACLQVGDFEEARQAFNKVLQLQPDSASARTALKQVNAKVKEMDSKLGQRLSKMFS